MGNGHAILSPSASERRDRRSQAVHNRLYRARGYAREHLCIMCSEQARDWAYLHNDPDEIVSDDGAYWSEKLECYAPMCRRCHHFLDLELGRIEHREGITETWGGEIGGEAFAEKRRTDPEFRAACEAQQNSAASAGGKAVWADPEFAETHRERMARAARRRWVCVDCGYVSNAPTVQRHLNRTGHSERREING